VIANYAKSCYMIKADNREGKNKNDVNFAERKYNF
jgi:hypothetical protein